MITQQEIDRRKAKAEAARFEYLEAKRKGKRPEIIARAQENMIHCQAEADHAEYIAHN